MKKIYCIAVLFLLGAGACFSQRISVPADYATIQEAIGEATKGDTVLVAEGTYFENINFLGRAITVASHFLLDGDTSHISKTIIDGSQPVHPDTGSVVLMASGEDTTSVLCGFTITGGTGSSFTYMPYNYHYLLGGGILLAWSGGKIEYNIFENNHLTEPLSEMPVLGFGVAAFVANNHTAIFRNNTIRDNSFTGHQAANGAGMGLGGGRFIIENNHIHNNSSITQAEALGGGIAYWRLQEDIIPEVLIRNNLIHNNELTLSSGAPSGGGIFLSGDEQALDVQMYNNIIYDNQAAGGFGGGITLLSTRALICNNTIVNNDADAGRQIFLITTTESIWCNNIIWSETGDMDVGMDENSFLYSAHNSTRGGLDPVWDIQAEPIFKEGGYALDGSSLCVGAGADSVRFLENWYKAPVTDYYGNPRKQHERIDLGAIESAYERDASLGFQNIEFTGSGPCSHDVNFMPVGGVPPFQFYLDDQAMDPPPWSGLCNGDHDAGIVDGDGQEATYTLGLATFLEENIGDALNLRIYPNPASDFIRMEFSLHKAGIQRIDLVNMLGQTMAILAEGFFLPGSQLLEVSIEGLEEGLYLIRMDSCQKLVKLVVQ